MEKALDALRAWCAPWLEDFSSVAGLDTFSLLLGLIVGLFVFIVMALFLGGSKFIVKSVLTAGAITVVFYFLSANLSRETLMSKLPDVDIPEASEMVEKITEQKQLVEEKMQEQVEKLEEIME